MKPIPFKPFINVSVAAGADPQGPGSVVAVLHVTARDAIVLRQHQIIGAPCEHLAGDPNPEDQKEIDKILVLMRLVARQLEIPIRIESNEIAALLYAEEDMRGD